MLWLPLCLQSLAALINIVGNIPKPAMSAALDYTDTLAEPAYMFFSMTLVWASMTVLAIVWSCKCSGCPIVPFNNNKVPSDGEKKDGDDSNPNTVDDIQDDDNDDRGAHVRERGRPNKSGSEMKDPLLS